jgi:hypothetical protein
MAFLDHRAIILTPSTRYCRVYCDYQVLRAWPKMWIPKYAAHKETEQWWLPWRIYDYSVQQRPDWDPALVLRLSYVYISARKLSHMMRIPPRILKNNELNWRIRCEQTANLDVDDGVDWDQFDFNIAGYKETILPPTDLPEDKPEDRPG